MDRRAYVCLLALVFLTARSDAQMFPGTDDGLSFYGLLGTVTVKAKQWQRVVLQPRFFSEKLDAVSDLELFLDEGGRLRNRGWDFSTGRKGLESILRKIHYLRYGKKDRKDQGFFLEVGDLEDVTLGWGAIVWRYRNTLESPGVKKTGVDLRFGNLSDGRATLRVLINNVLDLDRGGAVIGGRFAFHPSGPFQFGATFALDTDQLRGIADSLRQGVARDPYGALGIDVAYPLYGRLSTGLTLYGGILKTVAAAEGGSGIHGPGVEVAFMGGKVRMEHRWVRGQLSPTHFDALYELDRALVEPATGHLITKEATLKDVAVRGLFGDLSISLGPLVKARASYQHLSGNGEDDRRVEAEASLKPLILKAVPRLSHADAFYRDRRRSSRSGLRDRKPDRLFGCRVGLRPLKRLLVLWEVRFTYEPDGTGGFRRRRILNLQSQVKF